MADHRGGAVTVATKLGPLRIEFSERGLCRLEFRGSGGPAATGPLARQLKTYAAGKQVRFTVPLDLSAGTAFQQLVWRTLLKIPRGETRSYGWVAKKIGKPRATRAVGSACGANPVPIIVPCHRVIAGDGSLGGFSSGLALKRRLLALEQSR
ncbi:MAG: Methylated-DNA--protein-cysteine methyltransferase [Verrucomicrobiae bacterium]|nr:Methylated-DNA--protein-cysteine methyltransferase [Verrucomicrobiae bacterium]